MLGESQLVKMCKSRNSKTLIGWDNKPFRVDACMQNLIVVLNKPNYRTLACCCGHGKYNMSIIVKISDGRILDIISMTEIPRKKRFYVKDKDGYYYIPEVVEKLK